MMEPYTESEITTMRAAFTTIEAAYLLMDEGNFLPETQEHRRLNKTIVEELVKDAPDHEKIYYILNAINNVQNGKQQTATAESSEEEPKSTTTTGLKGWFKKINQKRKQT